MAQSQFGRKLGWRGTVAILDGNAVSRWRGSNFGRKVGWRCGVVAILSGNVISCCSQDECHGEVGHEVATDCPNRNG